MTASLTSALSLEVNLEVVVDAVTVGIVIASRAGIGVVDAAEANSDGISIRRLLKNSI